MIEIVSIVICLVKLVLLSLFLFKLTVVWYLLMLLDEAIFLSNVGSLFGWGIFRKIACRSLLILQWYNPIYQKDVYIYLNNQVVIENSISNFWLPIINGTRSNSVRMPSSILVVWMLFVITKTSFTSCWPTNLFIKWICIIKVWKP